MAMLDTAVDVQQKAGRVMDQRDKYMSIASKMVADLREIQSLVNSVDSGLGGSFGTLSGIYEDTSAKVETWFGKLSTIMSRWANDTISNEEQQQGKTEESGSQVENIKGLLNRIPD